MSRRFLFALVMAAIAMQSTGCCILRNVVYRFRTNHGCAPIGCAPGFGLGYSDACAGGSCAPQVAYAPVFGGAPVGYSAAPAVGAPGCASCYKPGVDGYAGADHSPAGYPPTNFAPPPSVPYYGGQPATMSSVPVFAAPTTPQAPIPTQMPKAEAPMRPNN